MCNMSYNLIAYSIYLPLMIYITVVVGGRFHKNGKVFIDELIPDDLDFAHRINNLLLIGYYLLNLGYVVVSISYWEDLDTWSTVVSSIASHSGVILLILALMHYNNMLMIFLYAQSRINNHSNKLS